MDAFLPVYSERENHPTLIDPSRTAKRNHASLDHLQPVEATMEAQAVAVSALVGMAPEEAFLHPMEDVKYSSITFVISAPPNVKLLYIVDLVGLVAL